MKEIAIIGGGAAGCFAAANIADAVVTVYERSGQLMQKVKVSGGGRCNVTNDQTDIAALLANYPRGKQLLKKTLHHFGPAQTRSWFQERGVKLKTEADGRVFPSTDDSQTIIDCIRGEMHKRAVRVWSHKTLKAITGSEGNFKLVFADDTTVRADYVLLATGGLLKPDQFAWLHALGHTLQPPAPSLFTFNLPGHSINQLMGIAVPLASIRIGGTKITTQGPLLITHWGMSGPAVLKASAFAARELAAQQYEFNFTVNWLNDMTEEDLKAHFVQLRREKGKQLLSSGNPWALPKRLWEYMLQQAGASADTRWGDLPAQVQQKLQSALIRDTYLAKGKTTFKEEFVTCGGITLAEVDPTTMESRKVLGLFFAGEMMDVDGITGGFNFQHAWTSGWLAARALSDKTVATGIQ